MTTYTVTTSNWNNVAFWNAINESGSGHELNFVSLPSTYSVTTDADSGVMAVSDGATIFTVSDSSFGGLSDVVLGGSTELAFFTVFTSGAGNDDIQLGAGDDQATGNAGEDTIDGGAGNDTLVGFTGNDSLYGDADNDSIVGGSGDDRLDGGTGNDTLEGGADADLLYGGFGDDHLAGGNGNDEIYTQVGNDTVFGGDGDDSVYGWYIDSNLEIHGEGGNDSLFGSSGNDTITGGVGNDTIEADNGADTIDGGAGDDRIYQYDGSATVTGGTGADLIDLGDDPDMVLVEDGFGNDTIIGGEGVSSGTDHDRIDFSALTTGISGAHVANAGTDIIVAGDTLNFSEIENIILTDQADSLDMLYESPVTVSGGAGNDTLRGSDFAGAGDSLLGGAGNDSVHGNSGDDILHGDDGNDLLNGGAGNDTIDGGAGDDTILADFGINEVLIGGDGTDTYQIDESAAQAWAYDVNLNTGTDQYGRTFSEIENVIGGDNNDTLTGDTEDNMLDGRDGADTFNVVDNFGNDTIIGGEGGSDDDAIDLSNITSSGVTVIYSSGEAGSVSDGLDAITFSEIENLTLTEQSDALDVRSVMTGVSAQGGGGNDGLLGGSGDDTLGGGDGDDYISGGAGNDFLTTGEGQDTLLGGEGNDTLMNSDGDDSLDGGAGDDSIVATGGEDTLRGGTGDDDMDGGDDADTFIIEDSFGNDTIIGGEGTTDPGDTDDDSIDMSAMTGPVTVAYTGDEAGTITDGVDTITFSEIERVITTDQADVVDGSAQWPGLFGDAPGMNVETRGGNDTITSGRGGDTIDAGTGDDSIDGDYGDDSIDGGDGNDTLIGGSGNDTLVGGDGNDNLSAGIEDDTLEGGAGDDTLTGGDEDDIFIYNVGDGADTITDFNAGNSGALGDGDTTNNDFIDLSNFYDSMGELRDDFNDDGVLNQSNSISNGGTVDYSDNDEMQPGDSLTFQGADQLSFTADNTGVVCFTAGTAIRTPRGDVLIDDLKVGDFVTTMDNGPQRIAWIGQRHVPHSDMRRNDRLRPVLIKRGVLGASRDLVVSRQHGMLLGQDYLGRAVHLTKTMPGVRIISNNRQVTYIHLMFAAHQIIFAENIPSESFYPGPLALAMLSRATRRQMQLIFPMLSVIVGHEDVRFAYGGTARDFLENKKAVQIWGDNTKCRAREGGKKWHVGPKTEFREAKRPIIAISKDHVVQEMQSVC